MMRLFIENERLIELVSDLACEVTTMKFGTNTIKEVKHLETGKVICTEYTDEAQEFFNKKYDEIEDLILSTLKLRVERDIEDHTIFERHE
jgi:hypothetical protein